MEMLAMRIVCSLVSVTVIFQLELFIILNVNYRNVCSSNRPQLRVLPGSSISAPWRVDFRNWQVDYYFPIVSSMCNIIMFDYECKTTFEESYIQVVDHSRFDRFRCIHSPCLFVIHSIQFIRHIIGATILGVNDSSR